MKRWPAAAISDAVLYEGYLLYPYRASAIKNQYRWMFGCLFPPAWSQHQDPSDRDFLHAEILAAVNPGAKIDVRLRCLVLPQCDGDDQADPVEREFCLAEVPICQGSSEPFSISNGTATGILGRLTIESTEVAPDVRKIAIEVRNETQCGESELATRDVAACHALLSTQLLLEGHNARFISLVDPPDDLLAVARACRNDGCWPVLAGSPGTDDQMLIAPIILYDYPQVAPESRGELFDGTEIDEMLTMRIRTLTDREKAEVADTDRRASELLNRSESMPDEALQGMHGVMRSASPAHEILHDDVPECLSVDGVPLRPGDQVRLCPSGRNDIFDLALAGQIATIATIERDFGGQFYFTVTADCDPGRDFGQQGLPGHRFFFRPDEVEPLSRQGAEEK